MKNIIKTLGLAALVGLGFAFGVNKLNELDRGQKAKYYEAIKENTFTITNRTGRYMAYVFDESMGHGFVHRKMIIEDKDQRGVYGKLTAIDYGLDGSIDEISLSQVPPGNALESLTLQEIRAQYASFTNSVCTDGKFVPIIHNYVDCVTSFPNCVLENWGAKCSIITLILYNKERIIKNTEILEFKGDLDYLVLRDKINTNNSVKLAYREIEQFNLPRKELADNYQKPFALVREFNDKTNAEIYPLDGISPRRYIR